MPLTLTMEFMEARPASACSHIIEWPKAPKSAVKSNEASEPPQAQDPSAGSVPSDEREGNESNRPLPIQIMNGSASEIVESQLFSTPNILITPQDDKAGRPAPTDNLVESPVTEQRAVAHPSAQLEELKVNRRIPVTQELPLSELEVTAHELGIARQGVEAPQTRVEVPKVQIEVPDTQAEVLKAQIEVPDTQTETLRAQAEVQKAQAEVPKAQAEVPKAQAEVPKAQAETLKPRSEASERGWLSLRRFTARTRWQEPQLSLGVQCHRIGGNECWEATGPALDLFTEVDGSIANLLDTLIEEIEDGQPVADNPLAFRMFMIGKSRSTARPTILFISQSRTSRKRAIKFVKSSVIFKEHPKIALADSAVFPMVLGRGPVLLFAANTGVIIGSVIGSIASASLSIGVLFLLCLRRRKSRNDSHIPDTLDFPELRGSLYTPGYSNAAASARNTSHTPMAQYHPNLWRQRNQKLSMLSNATATQQSVSEPINQTLMTEVRGGTAQNFAPLSRDTYLFELQGKSIICPSTGRKSKIGGLVYDSEGSYYGFTAAHVFQKIPSSNSNKPGHTPAGIEDTNSEFEFDEDDEVSDDELDALEVTAAGSANMSSSASLSQTMTAKPSASTTDADKVLPQENPIRFQDVQISSRIVKSEPETRVLNPLLSSLRGTDLGLDWALIDPIQLGLSNTLYRRGFTSPDVHRVSRPVRPMPRIERQVVLSLGKGKYSSVKGKLWPGPTMIRLSQGSKFVRLWSISVDTPIVEGDSGTWVVDAKNGEIYGHIVAGVPGSGNAFIIPVHQVCDDMESTVGPVELVHFTRDIDELM